MNATTHSEPIDRLSWVRRHNPTCQRIDFDSPFTVGNGGFAFGADITGLQTFAQDYHRWGVPTETLSRWAWQNDPNPEGYTLADTNRDYPQANGEVLGFPTRQSTPAGDWLRKNPRNMPLGEIRLHLSSGHPPPLTLADIRHPKQTLDLWTGTLHSSYELKGVPVTVITVCHPERDQISVRIDSEWIRSGQLQVEFAFAAGHDLAVKNTPALDWTHTESHQTEIGRQSSHQVDLYRSIHDDHYHVAVAWKGDAALTEASPHHFRLQATSDDSTLEFSAAFSPRPLENELVFLPETEQASAAHWKEFWTTGGAVDFSGSTDPRAEILERRVVLSQYLLAVQMAGDAPPQESGLTCSTWYGKHHTEMIWWHAAHFPLWGRDHYLEKNLAWYRDHLPAARGLARQRGLRGARWAKMVGPDCRESPGGPPLIVWNQPHMVHLAELLYRNAPTTETLSRYRDLVLETAECLASMLFYAGHQNGYVLGPPLWIAQEIYDPASSQNPGFELAYWRWALATAQTWRERLGLARDADWDHILTHLAPLPQKDGLYVALGSHPDTFDNIDSRHDHPTMLAPLGLLPGLEADRETMDRTLDAVLQSWDWETKIWGWDYPMIAMTAARLGRPETAVDILLRPGPNNIYLPNGHCPQRSDEAMTPTQAEGARKREIAAYLPANGAFLSAVALMVAGWDGCPTTLPGFPANGQWTVRAEGLHPLP